MFVAAKVTAKSNSVFPRIDFIDPPNAERISMLVYKLKIKTLFNLQRGSSLFIHKGFSSCCCSFTAFMSNMKTGIETVSVSRGLSSCSPFDNKAELSMDEWHCSNLLTIETGLKGGAF